MYSFETGTTRLGPELTIQHVQAVAAFAAALHDIHPVTGTTIDFRTAVSATFSFDEQVAGIRRRLEAFTDFAATPDAFDDVRELCRDIDVSAEVDR